jgi:cold shock CspA family protein
MKSILALVAMAATGLAGSASASMSGHALGAGCARAEGLHRQLRLAAEAEAARCGGGALGCVGGDTPEERAAHAQRLELRQHRLAAYGRASEACAAWRADETSEALRAAAGRAVVEALRTVALAGEWATGTVTWFNADKGYGFIARDDGGDDVFVHISAVERSGLAGLREGDRVEFELEVDRRGKTSVAKLRPIP